MAVNAMLSHWAGTLDGVVHWTGSVLVDVRVKPGGKLVIHNDTRVRLAGEDRLRAGEDPDRIELEIEGDFSILSSFGGRKVVFEVLHPGEQWSGIFLSPMASSRIEVADDSYELRDVERGVVFPHAPPPAARD